MDDPAEERTLKVKRFTTNRRSEFATDFPKLITMNDLEKPLKPVVLMEEPFTNLCSEKHNHEKSRQDCYQYFLQTCKENELSSSDFVYTSQNLVAGVPVADHLKVILQYTRLSKIGGSWFSWIGSTIESVLLHRQVSNKSCQIVRTIRLGLSSKEEVLRFKKNMEKMVAKKTNKMIPFRVTMIQTGAGQTSTVKHGAILKELYDGPQPAVICFGDYYYRYQIIIPWKASFIKKTTNEGIYSLDLKDTVDMVWYDLLESLPFIPFILDPNELVGVTNFFNRILNTKESKQIHLNNYVTLGMLLTLSEWDLPSSNLSTVNFMLTGGLLNRLWTVSSGFGKWGVNPMLRGQDLFLIGEIYGLQNALTTLSTCLLLHWFPSPVIAYTSSLLQPTEFIHWFNSFIMETLSKLTFKPELQNYYSKFGHVPALSPITVESTEQSPIISVAELRHMMPTWSNITSGGPASLGRILYHTVEVIQPILRRQNLPTSLKWSIQETLVENVSRWGLKRIPKSLNPSGSRYLGIGWESTNRTIDIADFDGNKVQSITNLYPEEPAKMASRSSAGCVFAAAVLRPTSSALVLTRASAASASKIYPIIPKRFVSKFSKIIEISQGISSPECEISNNSKEKRNVTKHLKRKAQRVEEAIKKQRASPESRHVVEVESANSESRHVVEVESASSESRRVIEVEVSSSESDSSLDMELIETKKGKQQVVLNLDDGAARFVRSFLAKNKKEKSKK